MTDTENTQSPTKAASASTWKKNKFHLITLPSSTVVSIQIPDLPNLAKTGALPNELVDAAIASAEKTKITKDDINQQADFYNKVCALCVVEPKVTEQEFAEELLPFEDKEMIVEFATRQRDLDAVGHHIGGLEKVKDFRTFRGLSSGLEDLELE